MARTPEEEQRRRRRKRIVQGLVVGGAAIGIPALVNALIARRANRLDSPRWGRTHRYAWRLGEIAFQRLGEGEPLVLVHSFGPGHDSAQWRRAAELLARDRSVFVPDLLGWGRSEKPALNYDGEIYIGLLADFLGDVVRQRATLVTAGLSSAYAVQLAVDHPELVRALALVSPLGIELAADEPDLKDAVIHRLLRLPIFGTSALNVYCSRSGIEHHLERDVFAQGHEVDAELLEHHYRASHEPGSRAALAAYLAGYLNHGVGGALPRVTAPIWIGWGEDAVNPPIESADLWLHAAPNAVLEVFAEAGVLPHLEQPELFVEAMQKFLATLPEP